MIITIPDEGLGNSSYLVDLGGGRALAVDASRDLRALKAHAIRRGLRIAFAADTHLHADFLSGSLQLARDEGARVLASAAGERLFDHHGLRDGDEADLGGLTLRAWATPGHTGEHLAFLLMDGRSIQGVFTGGSLIVGGAARTDLAGPGQTEPLARAQYASLRRLAALPDETPVWPTHGAGSFCLAGAGEDRVSTIGAEKAANPLLQVADEDAFVKELLGGLGTFPPYFLRLAEVNRRGPSLVEEPTLTPLTSTRTRTLLKDGAVVVDVRRKEDFARGHIPGAISIPLRGQFVTWLGWLIDPATPYIIVRKPEQDAAEVLWQALKIGQDNVAGELSETWDGPLSSIPMVAPATIEGAILDVRQSGEFAGGHLPGASNIELGALAGHSVSTGPTVVMCGHGERAMTGASLLARNGHRQVSVLDGGPDDWVAATGGELEAGQ